MWKKLALAGFLAVCVTLMGMGLFWWNLRSSGLPQRSGNATAAALEAPVNIRFDGWGVPHISSKSLRDAAVAQGWLHANDRMTQMELGRRSAAGRLAEVVGKAALPLDRAARILRLRAAAETLWHSASPESRELLEGYAAGVNAWLESRDTDLPPGLRLLRIAPEPWGPVDSLSFILLMATDLSFWQGRPEEARLGWLRAFGPETVRELVGDPELHIPDQILALAETLEPPRTADITDATEATPRAATSPPPVLGSNGWVLGRGRTDGTGPVVANDPHLGLHLPSVWYQALIEAPDYKAAGMTLPGVPGIVIGRSSDLAWGFTNTMLDDHDLFLEELDSSGLKVRRAERWVPLQVEEQWIPVRGEEAVRLELFSTDRGPLLEANPDRGLPPRSLAWTAYLPADPLAALVGLARAQTLEEIPAAVEGYVAPAQNLMVGHRDGGLLYLTLGRVPQRRKGNGRMPSPGWDPAYGWDGLRPLTTNPTVLRPASDWIVTANDDIRPEGYQEPFSAEFDTPYRAQRIRQLLSPRRDWRGEDQTSVQADAISLWALEILRLCSGTYEGDAAQAYRLLSAWDGTMSGAGAPTLFAYFERELQNAVFQDEEKAFGVETLRRRWRLLRLLRGEASSSWFDDLETPTHEGREEILASALSKAWGLVRERFSEDPQTWVYEEFHSLELEHPLGLLPLISGFFNRGPFPIPGSATTVNAMMGSWRGDHQTVVAGPSMRWVVDFARPDRSLSILPGGQSGHPLDPHYDDQLPLYLEGRLRSAPWSEASIKEAVVETLKLRP